MRGVKALRSFKVIHCADIHLDAPFREYGEGGYAETRRQDIRKAFLNILDRVKSEKADLLLISGDLYEHNTVTKSTVDWLNMKLSEVDAPVVVIPGNHDPYLLNSWYRTWDWPSNVTVLSPENPHKVMEDEKVNIYGMGFSLFKEDKPDLSGVAPRLGGYINILMLHGTLDMEFTQGAYKPVTSKELEVLGYDYYALGHFHKTREDYALKNAVNPGSPEPLGFDEPGEHGAFVVTFTEDQGRVSIEKERFITAVRTYQDKNLDISGCKSLAEVKIRLLSVLEGLDPERDITRITLRGMTDLNLESDLLSSFIPEDWFYLKIINNTRKAFDIEALEKDPSLKGAYVKEMMERLKKVKDSLSKDPENSDLQKEEERIHLALQYGLEALQNGRLEWWNE